MTRELIYYHPKTERLLIVGVLDGIISDIVEVEGGRIWDCFWPYKGWILIGEL